MWSRAESLPPIELRRFLKEKLPDHMVPAVFVLLDALPLLPNGKIDRRALPAPDRSRPELDKAFVAPRTPTEELLAEIWTQLLDIERVGIHDNFFDLGGHSLLATQVVSRMREAFQVEIPLRRLFEVPTVAGLAESIEAARRAGQNLSAPTHPAGSTGRRPALSPLPSSDCGSSISWNRVSRPTIFRPPSVSRDRSIWRRWSRVSMRSSSATNPCAPPLRKWMDAHRK